MPARHTCPRGVLTASGFCVGLLFENGKLRCAFGANLITRRRSLLHNFQFSTFNFQFPKRVHIAEQMQGLRSARKRSLLKVNEHFERKRNAADAREMCSQRVGFAWGFLCQTSEQLRSLLGANEEVAMRSLVQKAPARHARTKKGEEFNRTPPPRNLSKVYYKSILQPS